MWGKKFTENAGFSSQPWDAEVLGGCCSAPQEVKFTVDTFSQAILPARLTLSSQEWQRDGNFNASLEMGVYLGAPDPKRTWRIDCLQITGLAQHDVSPPRWKLSHFARITAVVDWTSSTFQAFWEKSESNFSGERWQCTGNELFSEKKITTSFRWTILTNWELQRNTIYIDQSYSYGPHLPTHPHTDINFSPWSPTGAEVNKGGKG